MKIECPICHGLRPEDFEQPCKTCEAAQNNPMMEVSIEQRVSALENKINKVERILKKLDLVKLEKNFTND